MKTALPYRRLLSASALAGLLALSAKVLQACNGIALAAKFGAGTETDAYLLAKSLPIGVYLILDNVLYNAVVPVYRREASRAETGGFATVLLGLSGGAALAALGILFFGAPFLLRYIAPGLAAPDAALAAGLCRVMSSALIFVIPASLLKAFNAAHGRYVLAALDSAVMNAAVLAVLLSAPLAWGVWPLAACLPAASAFLLAVQGISARRDLHFGPPRKARPLLHELAPLLLPLLAFNVLHQVNLVVMNAFLSKSGEGAVSWFQYSYNAGQIPVSVLDLILLSTVFPFASALFQQGDLEAFRRAYAAVSRWVLRVSVPCSLWVILCRRELVQLIFQRGRFDEEAVAGAAACLLGVGLAMAPWAYETMACRCLFALRAHGTYARIMALRVVLTAAGCRILAPAFSAQGVAFAFALSFGAGAFLSGRAVRKITAMPMPPGLFREAGLLLGALVAPAAAYAVSFFLPGGAIRVGCSGIVAAVAVALLYGVAYAGNQQKIRLFPRRKA